MNIFCGIIMTSIQDILDILIGLFQVMNTNNTLAYIFTFYKKNKTKV